jgi:iron-sulfur cluster repair protein YtfE (RIC family)
MTEERDHVEPPDLTTFVVLHQALRADAHRLALRVALVTEADRTTATPPLQAWYRGFCAEVAEHHEVEDQIWFPALADAVPVFEAHLPRLADEHDGIDRALARCGERLGALADPTEPWSLAHVVATEAVDSLRRQLDHHLDFEDQDVLPLLVRNLDAAEQRELDARTRDHRYEKLARLVTVGSG